MRIVEFYRGERGNQEGLTLEDMWSFRSGEFEMEHSYIQWLFPSNEASMLNCDAPVLTRDEAKIFQADPELRDRVKYSFVRILDFLDFRLIESSGAPLIEPAEGRDMKWLAHFNHNMLRVTRILKCLRLCGLTEYAVAFYNALMPYKPQLSSNTWKYWHDAVFVPLWPEVLNLN